MRDWGTVTPSDPVMGRRLLQWRMFAGTWRLLRPDVEKQSCFRLGEWFIPTAVQHRSLLVSKWLAHSTST